MAEALGLPAAGLREPLRRRDGATDEEILVGDNAYAWAVETIACLDEPRFVAVASRMIRDGAGRIAAGGSGDPGAVDAAPRGPPRRHLGRGPGEVGGPYPRGRRRRCARPESATSRGKRACLPSGTERARLVREMFDRIAGRYELLNTVMTAGLNRLWNREVVRATGSGPGDRALDLACGTGSLTRDLAKKVGPGGYVLGVDFSREMLRVAEARPAPNVEYRLGDATDLEGVPSGAFDAATIAYGARNIPDLDALFSEMARTLRPGGVAVCLEIARPSGGSSGAFYGLWFEGSCRGWGPGSPATPGRTPTCPNR